ncbi:MAG: site-specific integrase [Deltaproteobacteria bacterium]|nr:site-specific integrase [Deltaproteobacteria bacterium]
MTTHGKRRRAWGSVYRRGQTWWIAYRDGSGRRVTLSVGPSKAQADELLRRAHLGVVAGALPFASESEPERAPSLTVGEWLDRWLAERKRAGQRTHDDDKSRVDRHIRPRFAAIRIDELRPASVREWVLDLRASGLAPRTVRHTFATFRKALNDAIDAELIAANPCRPATRALPPDQPKDPIRGGNDSLARQEVEWLLGADDVPERRRAEVRGVRFEDVKLAADVPHVVIRRSYEQPTKTSAIRSVALHAQLIPILRAWHSSGWARWTGRHPTDRDLVFPRADGEMGDSYGQRAFRRDLAAARCHVVRYHDLRVTLGTLLRDAGAQKDNIAAILGHRDRSTTAIYAHVTLALQRAELDRLRLDLDRGRVVALPLAAVGGASWLQIGYNDDRERDDGERNLAESLVAPAGIEPAANGLGNLSSPQNPSQIGRLRWGDDDFRPRARPRDGTLRTPTAPSPGPHVEPRRRVTAAQAAAALGGGPRSRTPSSIADPADPTDPPMRIRESFHPTPPTSLPHRLTIVDSRRSDALWRCRLHRIRTGGCRGTRGRP